MSITNWWRKIYILWYDVPMTDKSTIAYEWKQYVSWRDIGTYKDSDVYIDNY